MGWPKGVKRGPRQKVQVEEQVAQPEAPPVAQVAASLGDPALAGRVNYASMKAVKDRRNWGNKWDVDPVSEDDTPNVLYIPREVYPDGIEFMWGTRSIRGQDTPQIRSGYFKDGWREVHDEDFQGSRFWEYSRNRWARDDSGYICYEACILLGQREEITFKAEAKRVRMAKEQLLIREQSITGGGMNATGAEHPSALAHNKIQRTVERIEIPKE